MPFDITKKRTGLTRIDCAVAVACVVFIFANVQVFSAAGRGHAKRQVCLANLRALTAAWSMYSNDHQGHLPCADVGYSEDDNPNDNYGISSNTEAREMIGPGWFRWPHRWPGSPTAPGPDQPELGSSQFLPGWGWPEADWKHAIWHGSLWTYIRDYGIYRCPVSDKSQYVTYTIAHSMNAYPKVFAPKAWEIYYNYQINRPAERMVFVDKGESDGGAYGVVAGTIENIEGRAVSNNPMTRGFSYDIPPKKHSNGTTFSFADGHAGYRKWVNPRTINYGGWPDTTDQTCNQDMMWLQKAVWGRLGYEDDLPPDCHPEF